MTTAELLIDQTLRYVRGNLRDTRNQLAAAIDADDTNVTFSYPIEGIEEGSVLGIGLEEVFVISPDATGRSAIVQRGYGASTAAAHAIASPVWVNPIVSQWEAIRALNDDILDLSSPQNGMFRIRTVDITSSASAYGYDLNVTDMIGDPLEVRIDTPGPENDWPAIRDWRIVRNMPTTDFASGTGITFLSGLPYPGRTVRVRYAASFGTLSTLTDDVAAITGLPVSAHDIPPLGAASRLLMTREAKRTTTDAQGDTRRASEVAVGSSASTARNLEQRRRVRIGAESLRLDAQWARPRVKGR